MKIEIITTNDGSNSLFVGDLNETYHSKHGAIAEANHVFIKNGINAIDSAVNNGKSSIKILEIGFGTGLNALLTAKWSAENRKKIEYTGVELNPVALEILSKINYGNLVGEQTLFNKIHGTKWESLFEITPTFSLLKTALDLTICSFEESYDLIYFDAFAPNKQEEMWSEEIFLKLYNCLNPGGRLTTYCAQGKVKRTLKAAGFTVTACQGPPGKREMTVAEKLIL